jgi:hypothetical protein
MKALMTAREFATIHALRILGVLFAAAFVFAIIQTIRIEGVWCSDVAPDEKPRCIVRGFKQEIQVFRFTLTKVTASRDAEIAKHKATKQAYVEAQEEAARLEAERLARVVARQEKISEQTKSEYRQRIAALRARVDILRAQIESGTAGGGAVGAPRSVPVSGTGNAARGIDDPTLCQRFPAPDPLTDLECRRIATEQATQLDALISWINRQRQVEN